MEILLKSGGKQTATDSLEQTFVLPDIHHIQPKKTKKTLPTDSIQATLSFPRVFILPQRIQRKLKGADCVSFTVG